MYTNLALYSALVNVNQDFNNEMKQDKYSTARPSNRNPINKKSFLFKGKSCQVIHLAIILVRLSLNFQFSNALRIIEILPVLKKSKVWTLYVHIVAQVNHSGLRMKVETNCLRDSI